MEVVILGSGSSKGVPMIACTCDVCKSDSKYNNRTRSSIVIKEKNTKLLIDFGYEIRQQLIQNNITECDAFFLTHDHADQVSGIDDLQIFGYRAKKTIPLYSDHKTLHHIKEKYAYLFTTQNGVGPFFHEIGIDFYDQVQIGDIKMQLFRMIHGPINNIGFRIGDFVYSNDVNSFPAESEQYLYNIKHWVLDCVDYKSTFAHAGLERVMEWYEKFKPQHIYLMNMNHNLDYHKLLEILPDGIVPSYDGLVISM